MNSFSATSLTLLALSFLFPAFVLADTAAEEAAYAAALCERAIENTAYANGNETDLIAFASFVDSQVSPDHPKSDECAIIVNEQKDIAVGWAAQARAALPIVEAENAKAQAAASVNDEGAAKHARELAEESAKICDEAAQEIMDAMVKAKSEYQGTNKGANEAALSAEIYEQAKTHFDLAFADKEALDQLSALADSEASPEREGSVGVAGKVRAEKAVVAAQEPNLQAAMALVETENNKSQSAGLLWNESAAKTAREAAELAAKDCEEAMKKIVEAYKLAKEDYYKLKKEEAKTRETELDEILQVKQGLKDTLDELVQTAIDVAEAESIVQSFAEVMKNLLQNIQSRLKIRMKKYRSHDETSDSGNGIEGTSGVAAGESLAELMQTIFRPLPNEVDGSIINETTGNCVTTLEAFRKVYFNQIEILQRGLPTPLLQHQFSKPFSVVSTVDNSTCIPYSVVEEYFTADWHLKDTLIYGGLLEMDALEEVNGKEFPFLSFVSIPSNALPVLSSDDVDTITDLWDATVENKRFHAGATTTPKDVYFPRTISLMYDNASETACVEYNKFGRLRGKDTLNAVEATTLLFTSALRLIEMGGSRASVAQMLANLSAFIFNGVRCLRKEGKKIRIPAALMNAYSTNTARIMGETVTLGPDPLLHMDAVEQVYATEIHAMTSFDTWGNYYFHAVYPDGHYDNTAFIEALYEGGKYNAVLALSSDMNRMLSVETADSLTNSTEKQVVCGQQFIYEGQVVIQTNLMEACCAGTCDLLNGMTDCQDLYLVCCERCNEFLCMSSTVDEMAELPAFSVIVPEYGEREPYAVPLMI